MPRAIGADTWHAHWLFRWLPNGTVPCEGLLRLKRHCCSPWYCCWCSGLPQSCGSCWRLRDPGTEGFSVDAVPLARAHLRRSTRTWKRWSAWTWADRELLQLFLGVLCEDLKAHDSSCHRRCERFHRTVLAGTNPRARPVWRHGLAALTAAWLVVIGVPDGAYHRPGRLKAAHSSRPPFAVD